VVAANRSLSEHRISSIQFRRLRDRYPRIIGPNARGNPVGWGGSYMVAIVTTDQGVVGWSMAGGRKQDTSRIVGMSLGDLFRVESGLVAGQPWWLDKLLHDLAARILQIPVWKMIGAAGPRSLSIYSGAIYLEDLMPTQRPRGIPGVIAAVQQDHDAGYRYFKLKMGRGFRRMEGKAGLERDIEVTRAVAEKFPDSRVLVDANDGWTVREACEYVAAVADCNLYWIEEPFEENREHYRTLCSVMAKTGCNALIADGESRKRAAETPTDHGGYVEAFTDRVYALAAERLINVALLDLDIVGFTRWRKLMPRIAARGVLTSPHTWMWTPRPFYAAQLAGGIGNVCIVEGIPGKAPGIDYSNYKIEGGRLLLPDAPGFGLELEGVTV
jgi:L-alanine-DL-glutamate epimerase-like enolase superfamily enzyme